MDRVNIAPKRRTALRPIRVARLRFEGAGVGDLPPRLRPCPTPSIYFTGVIRGKYLQLTLTVEDEGVFTISRL
jgi:hypothetical protein